MITVVFRSAGRGFIDQQVINVAVGKASKKVFNRFGAFTMRTARKLIKKAPKKYSKSGKRRKKAGKPVDAISAPGAPPLLHRDWFRRSILFAADERGVVIGPERRSGTVDPAALRALEYGGRSTGLDFGHRRPITVKARPFMGPAFARELPGLPAMWANSVR